MNQKGDLHTKTNCKQLIINNKLAEIMHDLNPFKKIYPKVKQYKMINPFNRINFVA